MNKEREKQTDRDRETERQSYRQADRQRQRAGPNVHVRTEKVGKRPAGEYTTSTTDTST